MASFLYKSSKKSILQPIFFFLSFDQRVQYGLNGLKVSFQVTESKFWHSLARNMCKNFGPLTLSKIVSGARFFKYDLGILSQCIPFLPINLCLTKISLLEQNIVSQRELFNVPEFWLFWWQELDPAPGQLDSIPQ